LELLTKNNDKGININTLTMVRRFPQHLNQLEPTSTQFAYNSHRQTHHQHDSLEWVT